MHILPVVVVLNVNPCPAEFKFFDEHPNIFQLVKYHQNGFEQSKIRLHVQADLALHSPQKNNIIGWSSLTGTKDRTANSIEQDQTARMWRPILLYTLRQRTSSSDSVALTGTKDRTKEHGLERPDIGKYIYRSQIDITILIL